MPKYKYLIGYTSPNGKRDICSVEADNPHEAMKIAKNRNPKGKQFGMMRKYPIK
jgi:hypothetical protein